MSGPVVAVVQSNRAVERLTAPLALHARARGWRLADVDLRPGAAMPDVGPSEALVLLGSVGLLRTALASPLAPRLSWTEAAFRADLWAGTLGRAYLGHGGVSTDPAGVARMAAELGRVAVRPLVGLKAFPGGVHDASSWSDLVRRLGLPADLACHAVAPTELLSEHRAWFADGRPVAAARYRAGDRQVRDLVGSDAALDAAARMTEGRLPLPDVVVDVAETPSGWRVVEMNSVHTSGWYAVDVGTVADALARSAARRLGGQATEAPACGVRAGEA